MDILTHFKILKLKPDASADEVKSAYKSIVKKWHPDRFNNDPVKQVIAEEKLKEINRAYDSIKAFLVSRPDPTPIPEPKKSTPSKMSDIHGKKGPLDGMWLNLTETVRRILNSKTFKSFVSGKNRSGSHSHAGSGDKKAQQPKTFDDILRERMASGGRTERMRQARKRRNEHMRRQMRPVSRQNCRRTGAISPIGKIRPVSHVERIGGDTH
ncbi:MAG: DnaJ domain-containing protein [Desulfobacterales bacterium]|nr:DnaJ domain-containing protein [Desulfobacterales bacterium]